MVGLMSRPKNNVSLTPRNREKTMYDIYYSNRRGERTRITASTTTILKGVLMAKRTIDISNDRDLMLPEPESG